MHRRPSAKAGSWRLPSPSQVSDLARGLMNLRSRSRAREVAASLETVGRDLSGFSDSMEGVFLRVGAQLTELQRQAREIAAQTTAMAGLLSHDEGSLSVLDDVLQSAGDAQQDLVLVETVQGIEENAHAIHRAVEAFSRLVNTFDVLGVMTRIESARFESAGATFVGLADAVMTLSRQIREHIGVTAGSAKVLLETTARAAAQIQRVAQTRQANLGPMARQASAGIARIADLRSRISQANARLATRFEGISSSIGDLVAALQSHDIVRQQIEHVLEALHRFDPLHRCDAELFGGARLQAAQLDNSRATVGRSIELIRNSLARIERNIDEVAADGASLLSASDAGGGSFFASVESNLAEILKVLDSNADADHWLADATLSVDQRLAEITRTIAGVQAIGVEMQRIALNATVQAARLGDEGGALEIVALAVQGLAREAGDASGTIESRLGAIRAAASVLDNAAASRAGAGQQIAQIRGSAAGLQSIEANARDGYNQTIHQIEGLKRQIGETVSGFGSQDHVVERLSGAAKRLHQISTTNGAVAPAGVDGVDAHYTMQSERAVHKALFQPVAEERMSATASAAVGSEEQAQEDNVEFF